MAHILSGWCVGNLFPLRPVQRLLCMVAATSLDLDGVSGLFGDAAFAEYHHKLHNLPVIFILSVALSLISRKRFLDFPLYLGLFHLHLLMDLAGSGFGWTIPYFWPIDSYEYRWRGVWAYYSWQNLTIFGVIFVWTLGIAKYGKRTPLEAIWPRLDRDILAFFKVIPKSSGNL